MRPQDEYGMFALRISILIASGARSGVYPRRQTAPPRRASAPASARAISGRNCFEMGQGDRSPEEAQVCAVFWGRRMMRVARLLWGASMAASFALWWAGARTCRWSGGILPQNGGRLRRVHIPGHGPVRRRGRVLPQLTARMHEDAGGYAKMDQCVGHQSGYQPLVSSGRAMAAVMPSTARSRS